MYLQKFKTLLDLLVYFKDEQVCVHNKVFKYSNGKVYKCDKCKRQYSVRVGTIFEDSKICYKFGLRLWL